MNDSTRIVLEWLGRHPDLASDLRKQEPATFRSSVTAFLYPYDRFPGVLDALLVAALDRVDWEDVFEQIGGP